MSEQAALDEHASRFDDPAAYARHVAGCLRRRRSSARGLAFDVLCEELIGAFAVLSLVRLLALAEDAGR